MEKMNSLVQQVKVACDQQNVESSNIVDAMAGIKDSAKENVTAVGALDGAVQKLSKEIKGLQEEMVVFKINEE